MISCLTTAEGVLTFFPDLHASMGELTDLNVLTLRKQYKANILAQAFPCGRHEYKLS